MGAEKRLPGDDLLHKRIDYRLERKAAIRPFATTSGCADKRVSSGTKSHESAGGSSK
jgi:hypothetical protein